MPELPGEVVGATFHLYGKPYPSKPSTSFNMSVYPLTNLTGFAVHVRSPEEVEIFSEEGCGVNLMRGESCTMSFSANITREGKHNVSFILSGASEAGPFVKVRGLTISLGEENDVWEWVEDQLPTAEVPTSTGSSNYGSTTTRSRAARVILLHGFDGRSYTDGLLYFGQLRNFLMNSGWTETKIHYPAYYACDEGNSPGHILDDHAEPGAAKVNGHPGYHRHHGGTASHDGAVCWNSGATNGPHDTDTPIEHLAYHFAWYIWNKFGPGDCVKIVGHSMGGIIARYALAEVEEGSTDFPPRLCVEDVVTVGTPHAGADNWARTICSAVWYSHQCKQLAPTHWFITETLKANLNPQGSGGTEWTAIGSTGDNTVTADEATGNLEAEHELYYMESQVDHGKYFDITATDVTADITYWEHPKVQGGTFTSKNSPWPNHIIDRHLASKYNGCRRYLADGDYAHIWNAPLGAALTGEYYSLTSASQENCWYKREVQSGATFRVVVEPTGDSDLYVYAGAIPSDMSKGWVCRPYVDGIYPEFCEVTNTGSTSRTYYLRVHNYDGTRRPFALRVADAKEDCARGRDASPSTVGALSIRSGVTDCKGYFTSSSDTSDIYRINVGKDEDIRLTLKPNPTAAYSICLHPPDGSASKCETSGLGTTAFLNVTRAVEGAWFIHVYICSTTSCTLGTGEYWLSVTLQYVRKDTDDSPEHAFTLNYDDDTAQKWLSISHKSLHWATSADLRVLARAEGTCDIGNSHRLQVNGNTQRDLNPCNWWSTTTYTNASFPVQLNHLSGHTPNMVTFFEIAGTWIDRNIVFAMDQSGGASSGTNSYAVENCRHSCPANGSDIPGEFMWHIKLDIRRP